MAQIPDKQTVREVRKKNSQQVRNKRKAQIKQGKTFEYDPYGPGVVPEKIWQNVPGKKISDPGATK